MSKKINNLNSFLKLGYFLDYENLKIKFDYSNINKRKYNKYTEKELIEIGSKIWTLSLNEQFSKEESYCVPLSGGLDSRAILGLLLEYTEADNIYTYTYGTPGSLDYDIGNYVAKTVGTKHKNIDLTKSKFNIDELIRISKRMDYQALLFHPPSLVDIDEAFSDKFIISGFMGDPVTGASYIKDNPTIDTTDLFIKKNTFVKSIDLQNKEKPLKLNFKFSNKIKLSKYEQINFKIRQQNYIAPTVLIEGFNYIIPFMDKQVFDFFLSIDEKYRISQFLYAKILLNLYPSLFKMKTKSNYGLPLDASFLSLNLGKFNYKIKNRFFSKKHGLNYLDYNYWIRNNAELKNIVYSSIMDLQERKIVSWININQIWKDHINNKKDYVDALLTLASLEIHLKAGKNIT